MIAIASLILGALPLAGGLLRFVGWLGLGWSGAAVALPVVGPALSLLCKVAEGALDLLFTVLRFLVVGGLKGADHISKSVPAACLFLSVVFGAWKFGPGDWRIWERDLMAPQVVQSEPEARSAPRQYRRAPAKQSTIRRAAESVGSTITQALQRTF